MKLIYFVLILFQFYSILFFFILFEEEFNYLIRRRKETYLKLI